MNLPNKLTISRLIISPVFLGMFFWDSPWGRLICFFLAVTIEITDVLDGHIARKYKQVTNVGKLLDPFADSVSRFTLLLCVSAEGMSYSLLYLVIIAVIFYRDITVANIRLVAVRQGVVIAARRSGKIKAIVQGAGVLLILALMTVDRFGVFAKLPYDAIYLGAMTIIALVTFASGIDYVRGNWNILSKPES